MLLAIALPLAILAAGVVLALSGHRYNRGLKLGAAVILAVIALVVVLMRNPGLLR